MIQQKTAWNYAYYDLYRIDINLREKKSFSPQRLRDTEFLE